MASPFLTIFLKRNSIIKEYNIRELVQISLNLLTIFALMLLNLELDNINQNILTLLNLELDTLHGLV